MNFSEVILCFKEILNYIEGKIPKQNTCVIMQTFKSDEINFLVLTHLNFQ